MKKILFISHEMSRTGAPMVLLYLLQWIRKHHSDVIVDVLALQNGGLEDDFKKISRNYYDYKALDNGDKLTFLQRLLLKLKILKTRNYHQELIEALTANNYNVIYGNTVLSLPFAKQLVQLNKKSRLILHVHELNAIIKQTLPNFRDYINFIDHFIAPSNLVKTNLQDHWGIEENIDVVYECSQTKAVTSQQKVSTTFTVGASGTVHWRKGHDVFVQVARYIHANYPDVKMQFVWVGHIPAQEKIILDEDLLKLGLIDKVKFIGEIEDTLEHYSAFDVFVMTSREDPFPLVCIELGMLGKPIICFEGATGTEEILGNGGGKIVPYLSIEAMASAILFYYENESEKITQGEKNKEAFSQFSPEKICPQLFEIISKNCRN
ncbi:glycosyltransferase family 4 protein [Hyunsoonleella sp. SJ7]|uniref:Glycosyltransferase family 4 protein n=1 Tax=Hyunsoonleella aquatilis TaxID=2762758 RepID=A0A923H9X7_9FLAO|nr:glycosyltransferase family 4 protein [Hyunsoonleella aquatilis]MBC3757752.1 glycosyltransferase family 4 protein [Hyunsoonleella aquatilis]